MLKVRDLSLQTPTVSLRSISLEVTQGKIVGIIGPNGSGKSELLRTLATPGLPYTGEILINHVNSLDDPVKAQHMIGYVSNPVVVDDHLTGIEYLEVISSMYDIAPKKRISAILEYAEALGCKEYLYTLNERLGAAFKQKLALIGAVIHEPAVLLLDEPWLHLDWNGDKAVTQLLLEQKKMGRSIVIVSNDLAKIESFADTICVIDDGELIAQGNLEQLAHLTQTRSKSLAAIWENLVEQQRLAS